MVCTGKERWQVIWHAIRKLRWHRSIHEGIDKGAADASMAAMLIFSAYSQSAFRSYREGLRVRVLAPKKRLRGEVIETCEDRSDRVRVLTMCGSVFFFFFFPFRFIMTADKRATLLIGIAVRMF